MTKFTKDMSVKNRSRHEKLNPSLPINRNCGGITKINHTN